MTVSPGCRSVVTSLYAVKVHCSRTDGTPIFRELSLPVWLVAINGRQVVELSGYSPFQAVPLPAGNATVRFSYLPPGETAAEVA